MITQLCNRFSDVSQNSQYSYQTRSPEDIQYTDNKELLKKKLQKLQEYGRQHQFITQSMQLTLHRCRIAQYVCGLLMSAIYKANALYHRLHVLATHVLLLTTLLQPTIHQILYTLGEIQVVLAIFKTQTSSISSSFIPGRFFNVTHNNFEIKNKSTYASKIF